jgi:DNA-directed RNA polymerase specialized sigma24 family protein
MESSAGTLGAVLYGGTAIRPAPEAEWSALVHLVAAGDRLSLRALYTRMHRVVFTLVLRIVGDASLAEELTLEVFDDLRRLAASYNPHEGTVAGWIMNLARSRAMDRFYRGHRTASLQDRRDVPEPSRSLHSRFMERIVAETGQSLPPATEGGADLRWESVAPGIEVQMLAADTVSHRVSMLVRLAPGGEYPPHTHAGVEELHLLEGELWIDDRKLLAGDYNRAEPGSADKRVWSETGCTCVLVTSTRDRLG